MAASGNAMVKETAEIVTLQHLLGGVVRGGHRDWNIQQICDLVTSSLHTVLGGGAAAFPAAWSIRQFSCQWYGDL